MGDKLKGFKTTYVDKFSDGLTTTLTVHNMSGSGDIAISEEDASGGRQSLILPINEAFQLASFIMQ